MEIIKKVHWHPETKSYTSGAYRPIAQWRMINEREADELLAQQVQCLGTLVVPFEFKTGFIARFQQLGLLGVPGSRSVMDERLKLFSKTLLPELKSDLESYLVEPFVLQSAAIGSTQPGHPSTTFDASQRMFRGLHIDNWCKPEASLRDRNVGAVRIIMNFGTEARDISFIPLSLREMEAALRTTDAPVDEMASRSNLSRFIETFLETFPTCPVYHIEQYPGEGCIIPVCNVVHDGLPLYKCHEDTNVQLSCQDFALSTSFKRKFM
ncbi:hypothetical protein [Oligoflexus tunisiensis]|uniref:hypothetical protein n=1 Tax=Oligoflexus tunisiensis TaxID=708132 RepID=UPI001C4063AE|nr:hypothetical protein [Oligoflexus tunisiensis]